MTEGTAFAGTDDIQFSAGDFKRPQPRPPKGEPTIWLDWETGRGVDDLGRNVEPVLLGRRTKNPILVDLLETTRRAWSTHLVLCGDVPTGGAWLLPDAATRARGADFIPGWEAGDHYLEDPPRGRFTHQETGAKVRISTSREWFAEPTGTTPLTPTQSRWLHKMLTAVVARAIERPDWELMRYPSQTMLNVWKLKAPDSYGMEWLDPDIGALIAATEPQHRLERFTTAGRCGCGDCLPLVTNTTLDEGFFYGDGRFMFHGVPKDLGAAPAAMLTGPEAEQLFTANPYHPARYRVTFTVPDVWDTLGLLPVKQEQGTGWHWPNRPGACHTTWAGAREVLLADEWGWGIQFCEGIKLTKANCLNPLINAVSAMIRSVDDIRSNDKPLPAEAADRLKRAIRAMFRIGIGAMSRRERLTTHWAASFDEIPDNAVDKVDPVDGGGGGFIYRTRSLLRPRDRDTWHPEIAAEVWSAARVLVLSTPTALKDNGRARKMGALEIPPSELLGITGDAIYTSSLQRWMLPTQYRGGGDDGRDGRIRIKGWLPGPLDTPATIGAQQAAAHAAETHGLEGLDL